MSGCSDLAHFNQVVFVDLYSQIHTATSSLRASPSESTVVPVVGDEYSVSASALMEFPVKVHLIPSKCVNISRYLLGLVRYVLLPSFTTADY